MKSRVMRTLLLSLIVTVGLALTAGAYFGTLELRDNFRVVVPDKLFRSGQLEEGELAALAWKHGIKTIINLRGENLNKNWYQNEVREAEFSGVKHIDFKMNSGRELTKKQTAELIQIMRDAPKPLLIHCQGGSDRSGLAAALYMAAVERKPKKEAEQQLSLIYGHLPSFGKDKMCTTFDKLDPSTTMEGS
jgi:protein tyrosine/serine phosphatase